MREAQLNTARRMFETASPVVPGTYMFDTGDEDEGYEEEVEEAELDQDMLELEQDMPNLENDLQENDVQENENEIENFNINENFISSSSSGYTPPFSPRSTPPTPSPEVPNSTSPSSPSSTSSSSSSTSSSSSNNCNNNVNMAETAENAPKLKNIIIEKFNGREIAPGLGSGFYIWLTKFEEALTADTTFNGSLWTDNRKRQAIIQFFEGTASDYYFQNNISWEASNGNRTLTYAQLTTRFQSRFGTDLDVVQINQRMCTVKPPHLSFVDHLSRLRTIATLLGGDRSQLILYSFVRTALPSQTANLIASIDVSNNDYVDEVEKALTRLVSIAGSGVVRRNNAAHFAGGRNHNNNNRGGHGGGTGGAGAAARGNNNNRGRSGRNTNNRGRGGRNNRVGRGNQARTSARTATASTECYNCHNFGHFSTNCPQRNQAPTTAAAANAIVPETGIAWYAYQAKYQPIRAPIVITQNVILDSGCTEYYTDKIEHLKNIVPANLVVTVADGNNVVSHQKGDMLLKMPST